MAVTLSKKIAKAQRRQQVADLMLQEWTQAAIAEKLGISQSTVSEDVKQVQTSWRESAIRDFDALRDRELAKLARVEREAWAGYDRSLQPFQSATMDGQSGAQKSRRTVSNQNGDPKYLAIILQCIESRREILGLDAPVKVAPTTPDGKPLSKEERMMHLEAILEERRVQMLTIDGESN